MPNKLFFGGICICIVVIVWIDSFLSYGALSSIFSYTTSSLDSDAVPTEVRLRWGEPRVNLCPLQFAEHHANPSKYPMFKDLVAKSCKTTNSREITMSALKVRIMQMGAVRQPSGFIFHESRCGSTLIANMLVSMPNSIVYSESAPPNQILRAKGFTREQKISYLQTVMTAMIHPPYQSKNASRVQPHVWFKFQSSTTMYMDILIEAFPKTPFLFLFRTPVQVMMSHLVQKSVNSINSHEKPPCLRTKGMSPPETLQILEVSALEERNVDNTRYCAASLETLCKYATKIVEKSEHGILLNYESLPHLFPALVTTHFGVPLSDKEVQEMLYVTQFYSKSRSGPRLGKQYVDDSEKKDTAASPDVQLWSARYMNATYTHMADTALNHLIKLLGKDYLENEHNMTLQFEGLTQNPGIESLTDAQHPLSNEKKFGDLILQDPPMVRLRDLLDEWSPDSHRVPEKSNYLPDIYEGTIKRFDYMTERDQAVWFRDNEIPFVVTNVPDVVGAKTKWTDEYLSESFGDFMNPVTVSTTNSFMYYDKRTAGILKATYTPPTSSTTMKFADWLKLASVPDPQPTDTHHYLLANSPRPKATQFIADDLPIFDPEKSFFMVDEDKNRGINCRFGMPGIIAEAHYDGGRNFIAMLRGQKRYVILPPTECPNLELYPRGHPESRHSKLDWAEMDWEKYPKFAEAQATQVVLRAGEVLYLPSYWFHYIVSLSPNISAQCNTRSGDSIRFRQVMAECGFYDAQLARSALYMTWEIFGSHISTSAAIFLVVALSLGVWAFFSQFHERGSCLLLPAFLGGDKLKTIRTE